MKDGNGGGFEEGGAGLGLEGKGGELKCEEEDYEWCGFAAMVGRLGGRLSGGVGVHRPKFWTQWVSMKPMPRVALVGRRILAGGPLVFFLF